MKMTPQQPMGSGFNFETTAEEAAKGLDLSDKTFVVTGGHVGIGLETVRVLSSKGATIIIGARDREAASKAVAVVTAKGAPPVTTLTLDLADADSVRSFADDVLKLMPSINVLIANAGVMAMPLARNSAGLEMQFATNHIGHFILTNALMSALERAAGSSSVSSRVVSLSSAAHRFSPVHFDDFNFVNRPYEKWSAYGQSKTANSLFAVELDRLKGMNGVRAFAVHPGRIVETSLTRHMSEEETKAAMAASPLGRKTIPQGAATTIWAATSPRLEGQGGVYCADCDISTIVPDDSNDGSGVRSWAISGEQAFELWQLSLRITH
jgi:NAD(P)-dependent dehydrogenase (short-subunit alcohol dehydrogenase family)